MRALCAEQWRCLTDKVITIEQAYVVTTGFLNLYIDFIFQTECVINVLKVLILGIALFII